MRHFIDIVENHEDEEEEYEAFAPSSFTLPSQTILYHGTNGDFDETALSSPSWVSNHIEPAQYFAEWHDDEGYPRIATYRLEHDLKLAELSRNCFDAIEEDYGVTYQGADDAEDFCRFLHQHWGFDGWIIPDNYGPGKADILLRDTSGLTHLKTEPLTKKVA